MALINLSVTVPDAQATAILNDFCDYHGYQSSFTDEAGNITTNPQTKAQFAKAKVASFIKERIKAYRANKEAEIARQAQITSAEAISIE